MSKEVSKVVEEIVEVENTETKPELEQQLKEAQQKALPPTPTEIEEAHAESKKGLISRIAGAPKAAFNTLLRKSAKHKKAVLITAGVTTFAAGAAAGYAVATSGSRQDGDIVDGEYTEIEDIDTDVTVDVDVD